VGRVSIRNIAQQAHRHHHVVADTHRQIHDLLIVETFFAARRFVGNLLPWWVESVSK